MSRPEMAAGKFSQHYFTKWRMIDHGNQNKANFYIFSSISYYSIRKAIIPHQQLIPEQIIIQNSTKLSRTDADIKPNQCEM